ncbi:MAG: DUF2484 family protein [Pseudomonadota bacterium]
MTLLWTCCVWVIASALVALLPMRRQYVPGVMLLVTAPVLIVWIALSTHWVLALCAGLAFISMYRNPLRYFWLKARGRKPELSK